MYMGSPNVVQCRVANRLVYQSFTISVEVISQWLMRGLEALQHDLPLNQSQCLASSIFS